MSSMLFTISEIVQGSLIDLAFLRTSVKVPIITLIVAVFSRHFYQVQKVISAN